MLYPASHVRVTSVPVSVAMNFICFLPIIMKRKQKAFFHAHRADDLFTAIRIAREFHLDAVLVHATEGHLIAG